MRVTKQQSVSVADAGNHLTGAKRGKSVTDAKCDLC